MSEGTNGWNRVFKPLDGEPAAAGALSSTSGYALVTSGEAAHSAAPKTPDSPYEVTVVGQVDGGLKAKHEKAGFPVPRVLSSKSERTVLFAPQVSVNYVTYLEGIREADVHLPIWVYLTTRRTQTQPKAAISKNNNAGIITLPITSNFATGNQEEVRGVNEMLWRATLAADRGSDPKVANRASRIHNANTRIKDLLWFGGIGGLAVVGATEAGEALSAATAIPPHAIHFPEVVQRITEFSVPTFVAGLIGRMAIEDESRPLQLGINKSLKSRAIARQAARMAADFKVLESPL
ncbi:MAG TPA: hypothetical protein VN778_00285 [Verrucomicrobiae bacterium]|nr:hypothetical protein [Verrucomicrobiae bacterium]